MLEYYDLFAVQIILGYQCCHKVVCSNDRDHANLKLSVEYEPETSRPFVKSK